jgi:hypothetical protein
MNAYTRVEGRRLGVTSFVVYPLGG